MNLPIRHQAAGYIIGKLLLRLMSTTAITHIQMAGHGLKVQ